MLGTTVVHPITFGEEVTICEGPAVLLSVTATEAGGEEGAVLTVRGCFGDPYLTLALAPGQSVTVAPQCVAPQGIVLSLASGAATVAVSYT